MCTNMTLDISANRSAQKYTRKELVLRVFWGLCRPLFRFSPRLCWGWRRFLLRCFGAKVGENTQIFPSVRIFAPWHFEIGADSSIGFDALIYNLGPIIIGDRVTVSQRAHLCAGTHNYKAPAMTLQKPPINIGDEAWICADAFVGPGVDIGPGSVVAAASVVIKTVEEWTVVGGNPARTIKRRSLK